MTYRKIEYSFDIRMKIRMLEVYLNLFFECISTYQIPKKKPNKQTTEQYHIFYKIQQKNICLTLILQSQSLCLYVFR